MLSLLNTLFTDFSLYSKSNPIIAGGIALWGLSVVTFICRHIPTQVFKFICNQTTTRLYFNDTYDGYNSENYRSFMVWFNMHNWSKHMRSLKLVSKPWMDTESEKYEANTSTAITGVGNGSHFFIYKRRLFIMHHHTLDKVGGNSVISEINLVMIGRNRKILASLVEEFSYKFDESKLCIYKFDKEWTRLSDFPKRPLDTVIIDYRIKNKIVEVITEFKASRDWFTTRGLPYKKTFILHGIPGTGKTSLIKALAAYFDMGICTINIAAMTDTGFQEALSTAPSKNIILIEDFDSASATRSRDLKKREHEKEDMFSVLSLSSILNSLDGVVTLDNKLIFLTTNVLETVDSAMIRKGRVDYIFELKALRHREVCEYVSLMFPDFALPSHLKFNDILGCDLQDLYFDYKEDPWKFIEKIPFTSELN